MKTPADYLALVTSEHQDQPLFAAVVTALTQGPADTYNVAEGLPDGYDLDTAVGAQLDAVGLWVGIGRRVAIPLTGVYFSWDDTVLTGWDSGVWQDQFDPTSGLVNLPDDIYRQVIRGKIAANNWDGTIPGAAAAWQQAFNGMQVIIIQDNQDMSMVVGFVGQPLDAVTRALLTGGYLPLKPEGVRISYFAVPVNDGPLFAWDANSPQLQGWGTGSWAAEIPST